MTFNGSSLATQLDDKAPKANPTFTGTAVIPAMTFNGSSLATQLSDKADKAGSTFTGQITSTRANNTADGQGQIYLNGATGNRIEFNPNGQATPTTGARSAGTKIVLNPNIATAGACDFAIGTDAPNGVFWNSTAFWTEQFRWYGGNYLAATLTGQGALTLNASTGSLSTPTITLNGVNLATTLNAKAPAPYVAFALIGGQITRNTGQISNITLGTRSAGAKYDFTLGSAHPSGDQFLLMVTPRSTSPSAGNFYVCHANVVTSTTFSVFCRDLNTTTGLTMDGEFYVRSIP
jgi:hypothetical protein